MSEPARLIEQLSERFDDSLVQMKPAYSGGQKMPYVSQGLVTKRLNAKALDWSSRILGRETITFPIMRYDKDAGKKILKDITWVEITLELTIPALGSRQEVGVAEMVGDYGTAVKAAASDALKRAAMRFGVALYMWESKEEQDGEGATSEDGPDMDWTAARKWLREAGFADSAAVAAFLGRTIKDWTPGEIVTAVQVKQQEANR